MAEKRYTETTKKESVFPFGLGALLDLDDDYFEAEVKDNETGVIGRGVDKDKSVAIEKAWKDVREKQGK